jgi:hypothetical protein
MQQQYRPSATLNDEWANDSVVHGHNGQVAGYLDSDAEDRVETIRCSIRNQGLEREAAARKAMKKAAKRADAPHGQQPLSRPSTPGANSGKKDYLRDLKKANAERRRHEPPGTTPRPQRDSRPRRGRVEYDDPPRGRSRTREGRSEWGFVTTQAQARHEEEEPPEPSPSPQPQQQLQKVDRADRERSGRQSTHAASAVSGGTKKSSRHGTKPVRKGSAQEPLQKPRRRRTEEDGYR